VGQNVGSAEPDPAFTAGLLHDLGKVVLAAFFPEDVDSLKELMLREALTYKEAEKALDLDHGMIGKALGEHWDLPPQLSEAMGYHHDIVSTLANFNLVATVHVADYLARQMGLGHSGNPDPPMLKNMVTAKLGLEQEQMQDLARQLNTRRMAVIGLWQTLVKS
jgi:HD-like signal output (HDOD) protein